MIGLLCKKNKVKSVLFNFATSKLWFVSVKQKLVCRAKIYNAFDGNVLVNDSHRNRRFLGYQIQQKFQNFIYCSHKLWADIITGNITIQFCQWTSVILQWLYIKTAVMEEKQTVTLIHTQKISICEISRA